MTAISGTKFTVSLTLTLGLFLGSSTASAGQRSAPPNPGPSCVAFDFNQDGNTNFIDVLSMVSSANSNGVIAQLVERSFASGCAQMLFGNWGGISPEIAEAWANIYLEHFGMCDDFDINDDNSLAFDDLQSILGSPDFTVPSKRDALQLIHTDSLSYSYDEDGSDISLSCLFVDSDGPLVIFSGLYENILNQIETCFAADMNDDGVLGIADVGIVINPNTPLSIPERIAYLAAIRSPMCAGGLDDD